MAETVQKNFRMSPRAIKLLHEIARANGITETDVVEFCVAKYALSIGQDVDRAKELLFQQICATAAKAPDLGGGRGAEPGQHGAAVGRERAEPAASDAARPSLPQTTAKLHDTVTDIEKAIHVAEGLVEKARKRGAKKK
jgi:hypothetical protein